MIDISKGRYWDEGIKLISGCTRISPGCKNCWSLAMEHRLGQDIIKKGVEGSFEDGTATGFQIRSERVTIHPDRLKRFSTRKPKVFAIWNDLFHEGVPDSFIEKVYMSMIDFSHNKYLILTKRPKRMAEWTKMNWANNCIWHGLTVCNQQEADEKIPVFLQVPGKKFLSIEPMLGAIDISNHLTKSVCFKCRSEDYKPVQYRGYVCANCGEIRSIEIINQIDAVILGGETGSGARPLHPDWVRSVRDQCAAAGVPFFFKQWGKWKPDPPAVLYMNRSILVDDRVMYINDKAGRELDGRTHDDLLWVK